MVYMDENGDAEGNYTLMARKRKTSDEGEKYGLFPVGTFGHREASLGLPVKYSSKRKQSKYNFRSFVGFATNRLLGMARRFASKGNSSLRFQKQKLYQ